MLCLVRDQQRLKKMLTISRENIEDEAQLDKIIPSFKSILKVLFFWNLNERKLDEYKARNILVKYLLWTASSDIISV